MYHLGIKRNNKIEIWEDSYIERGINEQKSRRGALGLLCLFCQIYFPLGYQKSHFLYGYRCTIHRYSNHSTSLSVCGSTVDLAVSYMIFSCDCLNSSANIVFLNSAVGSMPDTIFSSSSTFV